jgi:hypothetical protein
MILKLAILFMGISLSSLTMLPGGDELEIQAGGKTLVHQYMHQGEKTGVITLVPSMENDMLRIRYAHCGQNGTGRKLCLKDPGSHTVKEWSFANATGKNYMGISIRELNSFRNTPGSYTLLYLSNELKDWKEVAQLK